MCLVCATISERNKLVYHEKSSDGIDFIDYADEKQEGKGAYKIMQDFQSRVEETIKSYFIKISKIYQSATGYASRNQPSLAYSQSL